MNRDQLWGLVPKTCGIWASYTVFSWNALHRRLSDGTLTNVILGRRWIRGGATRVKWCRCSSCKPCFAIWRLACRPTCSEARASTARWAGDLALPLFFSLLLLLSSTPTPGLAPPAVECIKAPKWLLSCCCGTEQEREKKPDRLQLLGSNLVRSLSE